MNENMFKIVKELKEKGNEIHRVTITSRQRLLTEFFSTVSTHTEYQGYRYYRNRGSNDHQVRTGHDQTVNYYAKTAIKLINNAFKRSNAFVFFTENANLVLQKMDKKYYINGNQVTKTRLNSSMPTILMKMRVSKDRESFNEFVDMVVNSDPVISSAIINKIEYTFFNKGKKIVTLLNLEKTGKEHSAIELYEGMWVEFKDTQIKSFINSCRGNKNKYLGVSPEELYYLSRKEFLTSSEIQVVYAFLEQNRKSALVEQRSMELFKDLTERFKGKIFERGMKVDEVVQQAMAVKGKQLDWLVVDKGYKAGRQDVSTYAVICGSNYDKPSVLENNERYNAIEGCNGINAVRGDGFFTDEVSKETFALLGPICIDQAHTGISIGDQFAARSMALLNDVHSFNQVSTLRGYEKITVVNRVDWDALSVLCRSSEV